ncbi:hypothetical protein BJ742DRAFT_453567 [Cladochytrium replicatum]|nr:hypothetical protein BJ742DRAFT_453567 [Cladochytrium replicatum]
MLEVFSPMSKPLATYYSNHTPPATPATYQHTIIDVKATCEMLSGNNKSSPANVLLPTDTIIAAMGMLPPDRTKMRAREFLRRATAKQHSKLNQTALPPACLELAYESEGDQLPKSSRDALIKASSAGVNAYRNTLVQLRRLLGIHSPLSMTVLATKFGHPNLADKAERLKNAYLQTSQSLDEWAIRVVTVAAFHLVAKASKVKISKDQLDDLSHDTPETLQHYIKQIQDHCQSVLDAAINGDAPADTPKTTKRSRTEEAEGTPPSRKSRKTKASESDNVVEESLDTPSKKSREEPATATTRSRKKNAAESSPAVSTPHAQPPPPRTKRHIIPVDGLNMIIHHDQQLRKDGRLKDYYDWKEKILGEIEKIRAARVDDDDHNKSENGDDQDDEPDGEDGHEEEEAMGSQDGDQGRREEEAMDLQDRDHGGGEEEVIDFQVGDDVEEEVIDFQVGDDVEEEHAMDED